MKVRLKYNSDIEGTFTLNINDIEVLFLLIRAIEGFNGYKALIKDDGDMLVIEEYSSYIE